MKIKILEKLPELTPPEEDDVVTFKFPETDKISPPLLQLSDVEFGYSKDKMLLKGVNIDVGLDSRIGLIGANGAGKSTLYVNPGFLRLASKRNEDGITDGMRFEVRLKLLIGELQPTRGQQSRNGRLRIACESPSHSLSHVDCIPIHSHPHPPSRLCAAPHRLARLDGQLGRVLAEAVPWHDGAAVPSAPRCLRYHGAQTIRWSPLVKLITDPFGGWIGVHRA